MSSGYGCKEVYSFPHITYPYFPCICSFAAASLLLVHFFMFFVLVPVATFL